MPTKTSAVEIDRRPLSASSDCVRAVELIERYPRVTEPQLEALIATFRRLSALDVALILSDEDLAPKLDAFRRDHASRIRTPFRQYAVLFAIAVLGLLVVLWSVTAAA